MPTGRRTVKKLANGTRASFTYDAANRLTKLANLKSDGTTISSFEYKYDRAGNRTSVLEADGSRVTWSYDATYQLLAEHRTGSTPYRNTFTYDSRGNRTLKNEDGARTTYAYDDANQLEYAETASGRTTYTFDADGNQERVVEPSGGRTTTTWDYENKTTLVQLPTGIRNTMAYDTDGLRIKLEESTGTKKFIWDDQRYLAETDENNDTIVVYTNEPRLYGNLISQRRSSATNWFHFDALGSTRGLTDSSQIVTDTYLYDAWGTILAQTGPNVNPFRYVGELGYYYDPDSENVYVRARNYHIITGRWLSTDPFFLFLLNSQNAYPYTENSPIGGRDPSGLLTVKVLIQEHVKNAQCGDRLEMTYNFILDKANNCAGGLAYIVQKVDVYCCIQGCDKLAEAGNCLTRSLDKPTYTYYEAWQIAPGRNQYTTQAAQTDKANVVAEQDTFGFKLQFGEVRFYCGTPQSDPKEGWTGILPLGPNSGSSVYGSGKCALDAGGVIWSYGEIEAGVPQCWKGKPREAGKPRNMGATWLCCCQKQADGICNPCLQNDTE